MRKTYFIAILAAVIVLSMITASLAAPVIYVKNQKVDGAIPTQGSVYSGLETFLRAGGYSWSLNGNVLTITDGAGARSKITTVPANFMYNGKVFSAHSFLLGTRVMTRAEQLAAGLGLYRRYTAAVDAYDFYTPGNTPPSREVAATTAGPVVAPVTPDQPTEGATPAAQQAGKPETYKTPNIAKSLVQPTNKYISDYVTTGEVRGQVCFTNTSKDKLTKVSVIFKIVDGAGAPLYTRTFTIGDMNPGQKTQLFDYYWINPSKFNINDGSFAYEITYTPPAKQEDNKGNQTK